RQAAVFGFYRPAVFHGADTVIPGVQHRFNGKGHARLQHDAAIQKYAEGEGFSVVREYCGHGIGRGFHEEPQVLHYDADDGG
ncbi:M24 family metallopeptidase, partial [Salmonella enterica]|uniref:M24 family metallopeptidase n=1 Tax=Salmonella enterica TaxID=28901 RepID=UPI00215A4A7D